MANESVLGLCCHASDPALGKMPIEVPAAVASKLGELHVEVFSAIQVYQFCEMCQGIITINE